MTAATPRPRRTGRQRIIRLPGARAEHGVRYKVRFTEPDALEAALKAEVPNLPTDFPVVNRKRGYLSIGAPGSGPSFPYALLARGGGMFASPITLEGQLSSLQAEFGCEVVPEMRYEPEPSAEFEWWPFSRQDKRKMPDVLEAINACAIDPLSSRGEAITIAVVDSGVDPIKAEIDDNRRGAGFSSGTAGEPWQDSIGHGTRSAMIAGGRPGVAPAANVYPCRTDFYEGELPVIFDHLVDELLPTLDNGHLVITNSYGFRGAAPPRIDEDLAAAIGDAVDAGVIVIFSAGNYHQLAGGRPEACSPTTIWSYKCAEGVLTVAAARFDGSMQPYSSRGPGQLAGQPGMNLKPDVTAPVPGRWATSGACPQVAGLAALLFGDNPATDAATVRAAIIGSARPLGHNPSCEGAGLIDCRAALASS